MKKILIGAERSCGTIEEGKKKIESMTKIYADIFRQAGYFAGIYCNKSWYDHLISDALKAEYDFWIARYPKNDVGAYNGKSSLENPENKSADLCWP